MTLRSLLSLLCHPVLRLFRLLIAVALLLAIWGQSVGATPVQDPQSAQIPSDSIMQMEAEQRLQTIAARMESIRFCKRSRGCKYRDIRVTVKPGDKTPFVGEIDAIMDRPSAVLDKAHYLFEFTQDRWHLLGGEELSDVSSFFFEGDEYEVFSSYSARTRIAKLGNASPTLRVGYKDLYYQVLDHGVERDPALG